jgi:hypothetical protein
MYRGSPMKIAAAILFTAEAWIWTAVLEMPSLASPPPQNASSNI